MDGCLLDIIKDVVDSAKEDRYRTHRNLDAVYEQFIWIVGEIKSISKRLDALEEKLKPEVKPENITNSKQRHTMNQTNHFKN